MWPGADGATTAQSDTTPDGLGHDLVACALVAVNACGDGAVRLADKEAVYGAIDRAE